MSRTFPQLSALSIAHYPIRKKMAFREIKNRTISGETIGITDPDFRKVYWELSYEGLTVDEWRTLSEFFSECEGRLHSFTFLDPLANLLSSSEDLLGPEWTINPLLEVTLSSEKGEGGVNVFRITNVSQVSQSLTQVLPVPPHFRFCLSLYGRSGVRGEMTLRIAGGGGVKKQKAALTERWRRFHLSGSFEEGPVGVEFGIEVPPSGSIEVMGLQVDPQAAPDGYRPTGVGGVYPESRFISDEIHASETAPGLFACEIGVVSRMERG